MPGNCCGGCGKAEAKSCCGGCKSVFYCDRTCQVKHWNAHKLECKKFKSKQEEKTPETLDMNNFIFTLPPFDDTSIRITQTNDRGYGMFANHCIKKGTIIYKECAMMVLPDYAKQKMTFYIRQQYLLLSETQQNIYKSLSRDGNITVDTQNDELILLNIFANNQIANDISKACCIFPVLSRINHSCIGNAHWIWNEKHNQRRLIAVNDIDQNNEIFVNYFGNQPIESGKRKIELKAKWNIECKCNWCVRDENSIHKLDEIINEYNKLDESLDAAISNPLNGYKISQKLIKIVEKHFNSNPNLMHTHCYDSAQFALGLQKWSEASYFLEQSMKEKQMAEGDDIQIGDVFMDKVRILPTKFRSRFRKFDPKYNKARMQKKQKQTTNDDVKHNGQKNKNKSNSMKNAKKSNVKSNGKKKGNRNNKSKNKKNKGKKTKK